MQKYYDSGAMQALQKKWTEKGVIWLTVNSTKASHSDASRVRDYLKSSDPSKKMASSHLLLDQKGVAGKAFGAKTTPHLFILGADGKLAYQGAIDDRPTTEKLDLPSSDGKSGAKPLVDQALTELSAGKPFSSSSNPYGCGIKYE